MRDAGWQAVEAELGGACVVEGEKRRSVWACCRSSLLFTHFHFHTFHTRDARVAGEPPARAESARAHASSTAWAQRWTRSRPKLS